MRLHLKYGCAAALAMFVAAQAALATATLTQDNRELEVELSIAEGFNQIDVGPDTTAPDFGQPFAIQLATGLWQTQPAGDAQAEATAVQNSSFDSFPNFTSISASGVVDATGSVDAFALQADASSSANSDFKIVFSIDVPMTWTIDASILDEGSGSTGYVRLRDEGGGTEYFILNQNSGVNELADSGLLQPGSYELEGVARAAGAASTSGAGFYGRDAEFALDFTIIPEPASGLLLVLGGVIAMRRRSMR